VKTREITRKFVFDFDHFFIPKGLISKFIFAKKVTFFARRLFTNSLKNSSVIIETFYSSWVRAFFAIKSSLVYVPA